MKKITPEILERYYTNSCSSEEKQLVSDWLNTKAPQSLNEEKILVDTWKKITVKTLEKKPKILIFKKSLYYKYGSIAASLVILLFTSIYIFNTFFTTEINGIAYTFVDFTTLSTEVGKRETFTISDGSIITLNSGSEIKVPKEFTKDNRVVHLKGHAHFDVQRDESRPFIIYTENSKTQVLGTSFDVITNTKSKDTKVIVSSGKVRFSELNNQENKVDLTVDQQGLLSLNTPIEVNEVDSRYLTAWKDNILMFENNSFNDIIKVIESWYAINITVENKDLLHKQFTFTYDNPSLQEILERMSFVAEFKYTIKGNNVIIY